MQVRTEFHQFDWPNTGAVFSHTALSIGPNICIGSCHCTAEINKTNKQTEKQREQSVQSESESEKRQNRHLCTYIVKTMEKLLWDDQLFDDESPPPNFSLDVDISDENLCFVYENEGE